MANPPALVIEFLCDEGIKMVNLNYIRKSRDKRVMRSWLKNKSFVECKGRKWYKQIIENDISLTTNLKKLVTAIVTGASISNNKILK